MKTPRRRQAEQSVLSLASPRWGFMRTPSGDVYGKGLQWVLGNQGLTAVRASGRAVYGPGMYCWPETNRLPDISPVKMGLFKISRELQFWVCNHNEPYASPQTAREGGCFYRGEKEVGRDVVNRIHGFSLTESLPGKKSSSLLGSSIVVGGESSPFWSPNSI